MAWNMILIGLLIIAIFVVWCLRSEKKSRENWGVSKAIKAQPTIVSLGKAEELGYTKYGYPIY